MTDQLQQDMSNITSAEQCVKTIGAYDHDCLIVAFTGRSGADLDGVSDLLTGDVPKQVLFQTLFTDGFEGRDIRELRIIQRFLRERWQPFVEVSANAAMLSFLFDENKAKRTISYSFKYLFGENLEQVNPCGYLNSILQFEQDEIRRRSIKRLQAFHSAASIGFAQSIDDEYKVHDRIAGVVDDILADVDFDALAEAWRYAQSLCRAHDYSDPKTVALCFGVFPSLVELLKEKVNSKHDALFSLVFQRLGNEIREYGSPYHAPSGQSRAHLFDLPRRISEFCDVARHYCCVFKECSDEQFVRNPIRISLCALKNPYEALYLRQRYANFYLVSISSDRDSKTARTTMYSKNRVMGYVDMGESPAVLKEAIRIIESKASTKNLEEHWQMLSETKPEDYEREARACGLSRREFQYALEAYNDDQLRFRSYRNGTYPFILQDVVSCIESADVFITRDEDEEKASNDYRLLRLLARFVVLAMHPGLLKPTKLERCMQIAMSAKLNSGCLSRQVGAVVADSDFNILSLGWNDAPHGSEVCARRNFLDIANKFDQEAYSNFELHDAAFREYMERVNACYREKHGAEILKGLPAAYCFKDVYQDIIGVRDQIHTRALHAEERALSACGNDRAKGGYLFTTSSPCELCAKKAKEAGIKRIYYIERYKGISYEHIIDEGPLDERAEYVYFVGAVGQAYMKLYTPAIPYKDELHAIEMTPPCLHKQYLEATDQAVKPTDDESARDSKGDSCAV